MSTVSLGFATSTQQYEQDFPYQPGFTVANLLSLAQWPTRWPQLNWTDVSIGIWGKVVDEATVLQPGDRVELYPPLIIDPKTARRLRSRKAPARARPAKEGGERPDKG